MRLSPEEPDFSQGFTSENDIFNRKALYEKIINVVNHSEDSNLVLALNDKWGNGKTSFVKMLKAELELSENNINVIYFDSFKNDYQKDPLLPMISCVYNSIEHDEKSIKEKVFQTGKSVALSISKQVPKSIINILTSKLIDSDDIDKIKESIVDATNAPWESYIEDKIKNSQEEEDKIESFRAILRSIHQKTNNKTLFIIDELDRARPDFSLNLLELIKHIFNVEGFYFLLVMNKQQFEESIKIRYGNINSSLYLNKFIDYWFTLPKDIFTTEEYINSEGYRMPKHLTLGAYLQHIDKNNILMKESDAFNMLLYLFNFNNVSLREIEKCYSLISIIKNSNKIMMLDKPYQVIVALVCFLKINNEPLLDKLKRRNTTPEEVLTLLNIPLDQGLFDTSIHYLYIVLRYELLTGEEFKKLKNENYFIGIEGYAGRKVRYLETITDYFENMSID